MDQNNTSPAPSAPAENHNLLMSILSYIGPLVVVSYLTSKDKPVVKFHIKQGLVLLSIEIILYVVSRMFWALLPFISILEFAVFVLVVVGIINVCQKKEKELPVVGSFAKYFNI